MAERLYSMRFDFIQCRTLPNTIATVLLGSLVERTVYSLDIYTHIDKVIEESHTNLRAFFRTLCIFVCVREMSCCFFYALHNTLWITEQHAIETRGLISISQAFWIEIPTKKKETVALFPPVIMVHLSRGNWNGDCIGSIEFGFRRYSKCKCWKKNSEKIMRFCHCPV